jgi:hypothetical protein
MKIAFRKFLMFILMVVTVVLGACEKKAVKKGGGDSVAVFDNLWKTMDSRYAMFSYKKVDWKKIYTQYRPLVSNDMDDEQLFSICTAMLDSLKDGHVSLIAKNNRYAYNGYYLSYTRNFNYDQLKVRYLKNSSSQGILTYAMLDYAGYLYIPSFGKQLKTDDIDNVLSILSSLEALIIDVRDNTGGESALVDFLTARFLKERKLVKYDVYKKGPGHDDFLEPVPKFISPVQNIFSNKKVIVLTNRRCFSSCNDFVLYMSLLPNVVIIGDQTGGGGGTPFNYELPNGWLLGYSASFATAPDGSNIESGINPNIPVSNTLEDETKGKDAILEAAFKQLNLSYKP